MLKVIAAAACATPLAAFASFHAARAGLDPATLLARLIGEPATVRVETGDTLLDVAFRHRVGIDHLARLNPGIDLWIPEAGLRVELPTQQILPQAEHEGLIINLPEMRLYDFTRAGSGEVRVLAIAIGDALDPTPVGDFRVGEKRIEPVWRVPKSIREERPELPPQVPPGPENPLGDRWMTLGHSSYGIHGTNNHWSIGRMSTHGCVRLYEDSMQDLFDRVPSGTRVQVLYEPVKIGRLGDGLYVEAHPDIYGRSGDLASATLVRLLVLGLYHAVDRDLLRQAVEEARGVPVRIGTLPRPSPAGSATS